MFGFFSVKWEYKKYFLDCKFIIFFLLNCCIHIGFYYFELISLTYTNVYPVKKKKEKKKDQTEQ